MCNLPKAILRKNHLTQGTKWSQSRGWESEELAFHEVAGGMAWASKRQTGERGCRLLGKWNTQKATRMA